MTHSAVPVTHRERSKEGLKEAVNCWDSKPPALLHVYRLIEIRYTHTDRCSCTCLRS